MPTAFVNQKPLTVKEPVASKKRRHELVMTLANDDVEYRTAKHEGQSWERGKSD